MNEDKKPMAYILVGLPGSGKSTWVDSLTDFDAVLLSTDAFIEEQAKKEKKTYSQIFEKYVKDAQRKFDKDFKTATEALQNIVIDQTNLGKPKRAKLLSKLKDYDVTAVCFEISQDELNRRRVKRENETGKTIPAFVLSSMAKNYDRPDKSEGFKEVIVIGDNG